MNGRKLLMLAPLLAVGGLFANSYSNQIATAAVGPVTVTCANSGDWQFALATEEDVAAVGVEKGAKSVLAITLTAPAEARLPVFDVSFDVSGADITHVWTSSYSADTPRLWPSGWGRTRYSSQLAFETPLAVALNENDRARLAMAASEAFEKVLFGLVVNERTCRVEGRFRFFTENASPRRRYTVKILLDGRDAFWGDAVREASAWIGAVGGLVPAEVPEAAHDPLYSTWYAYMQNVHADELEKEAALAAQLGMKAMILDDGWQKKESASFYSATGDWNPVASRFPDMKAHVDAVHKAGLKYMLWLSVPYVGDESQAWKRFEGKFLKVHGAKSPGKVAALDPRYPDVRAYLIGIYERAVRDWGFDGLKLDFIDQFVLPSVDPAAKTNYAGCDYKSLPEAVDRLMKDVLVHLKAIRPDVLLEFRQHYMGPAIRQYGNMIRAADCPADPQANRVRIANLRLTSGETAVHADMLAWSPDERPEGAARPILNALFGVIQYSMVLQQLPKPHQGVIRHWLAFTEKHRETLLKGTFKPHHPELNYPLIEAESAAERIFAAYTEGLCVDVGAADRPVYVVNAAQQTGIALNLEAAADVELFDVYGTSLGSRTVAAGLAQLPVPPSGHLKIVWKNVDLLAALAGAVERPTPIPLKSWGAFEGGATFTPGGEVLVERTAASPRRSGASWSYRPDQAHADEPFAIEAEGFSESFAEGEALIYVDISYQDGTSLWGQKAYFKPTKTVGWHTRRVLVAVDRPIRHANVYLMAIGGTGKFRFRNPKIVNFPGAQSARFDGLAVQRAELPAEGGFLLRDAVSGGYAAIRPGETVKGVTLTVKETPRADGAKAFDVLLSGVRARDRALTLVYAAPLAAGPVTWHADICHAEDLADKAVERVSGEPVSCGQGRLSKWPFGAASAGGKGIALGLDPEAPAFFRTGVNMTFRRAFIAFDVGLAPEKNAAHFGFVAYPFAADEGFRGALEGYRRLFPEVYKVRAPKQGVWMAFRKISSVPNFEDFGFAFKEGNNETAWDDAHGFYTFRYTEPTTWWMSIGGQNGRKYATREECLAKAQALVQKGERMAKGWQASAMLDEEGEPSGRILDTPWCNGIVWNVNSAPGIPGGDFTVKNGEPTFSDRFKGDFPAGLDGEYVDSAEMYVTDTFDYDRTHFRWMETPLVWAPGTFRPAIFKGLIGHEYVKALARKVHAKGRLMMANGVPNRWCWQIPYIDVTGTETDWNGRLGWRPTSPQELLHRRALIGGKPYCFLMNTDFSKFGYDKTEKFMMRALAFGMFPGFFSQSATSRQGSHYFDHPEYYDPVRPLFKKYVPLTRTISEAGWRPVNRLLKVQAKDVYSEQFGERHVTLFNASTNALTVTVTARGRARELVTGSVRDFDAGPIKEMLPPETVRLFEFCK